MHNNRVFKGGISPIFFFYFLFFFIPKYVRLVSGNLTFKKIFFSFSSSSNPTYFCAPQKWYFTPRNNRQLRNRGRNWLRSALTIGSGQNDTNWKQRECKSLRVSQRKKKDTIPFQNSFRSFSTRVKTRKEGNRNNSGSEVIQSVSRGRRESVNFLRWQLQRERKQTRTRARSLARDRQTD